MKFKTLNGYERALEGHTKYKIDWRKKSRSKFQTEVKKFLQKYWFYDNVYEEFRIAGTKMSLDFYNHSKRVAVEVQGRQHSQFVEHFHGSKTSRWIKQLKHDAKKWDFCVINGISLVEIYENDPICEETFKKQGVLL